MPEIDSQTQKREICAIFYTEDLPNTQKYKLPFLKGCPLEFETSGSLINIRYKVASIDKSTISDEYFKLPENYKMIKDTKKRILEDKKEFMTESIENNSTGVDR